MSHPKIISTFGFSILCFLLACGHSYNPLKGFHHSYQPLTHLLPLYKKIQPLGFDQKNIPKEIQMILREDSTIGIWETQTSYLPTGNSSSPSIALIWPHIFKFDGTYLTTHFIDMFRWTPPHWFSEDGYYKMKTRWFEDTLKYRTPYNDWKEAGVFKDSVFSTVYTLTDTLGNATNHTIHFRKIKPEQVASYDKPILKYRKVFNYDQLR